MNNKGMESGERCRRERNRGFMYKIRIEESFDSAHFLAGYEGKCNQFAWTPLADRDGSQSRNAA